MATRLPGSQVQHAIIEDQGIGVVVKLTVRDEAVIAYQGENGSDDTASHLNTTKCLQCALDFPPHLEFRYGRIDAAVIAVPLALSEDCMRVLLEVVVAGIEVRLTATLIISYLAHG